MTERVLDASALIALVRKEPGWDNVALAMPHAIMSAVNFCETIQGLRRRGMPPEVIQHALKPLIPAPVPFDETLAYVAASLHERTRGRGISFGDCALCSDLWIEADQWQQGPGASDPAKAAESIGAKQAINQIFQHVRSLRDGLRKPPA